METENIVDNNLPKPLDPLLEKVKNTFFSEYFPIQTFKPGTIFMSSNDIYNLFYNHYPNPVMYSVADIANWLHERGYQFMKTRELHYEWMLYPADI